MDCGDGVTVNVCSSDEDCNSGDNGAPILATSNRPELYAYSDTDAQSNVIKSKDGKNLEYVTNTRTATVLNMLHPQAYEILAKVQDSISKDVCSATDTTDSHSALKSTITASKDSNGGDVVMKPAAKGQLMKIDLEECLQNGRQNGQQQQQQELATPQQQLQHRESISCGIEESTEVLLINSADCNDRYFGDGGRAYSATDSDVEVLMSEEIGESDWSAGDTATGEHTPEDPNVELTTTTKDTTNQGKQQNQISDDIALIQEAASTQDDDISVEMSSHSKSLSINEPLDKENLLKIIGEQAASIHKLKSVVDHYRRAHLMLYKHAEAIQFTLDKTDEDLDKLGFPHRVKP